MHRPTPGTTLKPCTTPGPLCKRSLSESQHARMKHHNPAPPRHVIRAAAARPAQGIGWFSCPASRPACQAGAGPQGGRTRGAVLAAPTAVPACKGGKGTAEQHRAQLPAVMDVCNLTQVRTSLCVGARLTATKQGTAQQSKCSCPVVPCIANRRERRQARASTVCCRKCRSHLGAKHHLLLSRRDGAPGLAADAASAYASLLARTAAALATLPLSLAVARRGCDRQ